MPFIIGFFTILFLFGLICIILPILTDWSMTPMTERSILKSIWNGSNDGWFLTVCGIMMISVAVWHIKHIYFK